MDVIEAGIDRAPPVRVDAGIADAPQGGVDAPVAGHSVERSDDLQARGHAVEVPPTLPARSGERGERPNGWTFLTNHAHVLLAIALDPRLRIRDVAVRVGITERAAQRILHDLVAEGYVEREKHGRRNTYRLVLDRPLRHPIEASHTVRALIDALCRGR